MDDQEIQRIAKGTYKPHTHTVRKLIKEIRRLKQALADANVDAMPRVPVLLVGYGNGDVACYAGKRAVVEIVDYPVFGRSLDKYGAVEELIRLRLPRSHRAIAFAPKWSRGIVGPRMCKPLAKFVEGLDREAEFKWWDQVDRILEKK